MTFLSFSMSRIEATKFGTEMTKRPHLPLRRTMNLINEAYAKWCKLTETYGRGNNDLLVVLLEKLDHLANQDAHKTAFQTFIAEYEAPKP